MPRHAREAPTMVYADLQMRSHVVAALGSQGRVPKGCGGVELEINVPAVKTVEDVDHQKQYTAIF